MNEISAAIGIEQLKRFPYFLKQRKKNYNYIFKNLKKKNIFRVINFDNEKFKGSYYCFCIILNKKLNRLSIINKLNSLGIGTSIYYPKPIPLISYYKKKFNYKKKQFPNAEIFSYQSIAIPVGTHLKKDDLNLIVNSLNKVFEVYE
jgi:dTDP-4-amino-4,6-dideoxygalactose transaminase